VLALGRESGPDVRALVVAPGQSNTQALAAGRSADEVWASIFSDRINLSPDKTVPELFNFLARFGDSVGGEADTPKSVLQARTALKHWIKAHRAGKSAIKSYPMITVQPGIFEMGSEPGEPGHKPDRQRHEVTLTHAFALGRVEVTQGLYQAVMGENPMIGRAERFGGFTKQCTIAGLSADTPIVCLELAEIAEFANSMSILASYDPCYVIQGAEVTWPRGPECTGYRLPTEAEWEYAARAGQDDRYGGSDLLAAMAWADQNGELGALPVAQRQANAWGFHDMIGNVGEVVWDFYARYSPQAVTDPVGPRAADHRTSRGGSWISQEQSLSVAYRSWVEDHGHTTGLRLARTIR